MDGVARRATGGAAATSVVGPPAVDGAGLDDRAAGRRDEAEPDADRLAGGRPSGPVARADRLDRGEGLADLVDVEAVAAERLQTGGVDPARRAEELAGLAVHDDSDVDELLAIDPGHAA